MINEAEYYMNQHEKLINKFYINSTEINLYNLFENDYNSNLQSLAEEFIKLCSVSTNKQMFENFLIKFIEKYPLLGVKYYDELFGFESARSIIHGYFEKIKKVVNEQLNPDEFHNC